MFYAIFKMGFVNGWIINVQMVYIIVKMLKLYKNVYYIDPKIVFTIMAYVLKYKILIIIVVNILNTLLIHSVEIIIHFVFIQKQILHAKDLIILAIVINLIQVNQLQIVIL